MDEPDGIRGEIRDFLVSRRARLSPGDVGIPDHGRRRVQGLRREEVAMLAGVSVEYYVKLERGDATGASPSVINAVARVLRLTDIEREHLKRLMFSSDEVDVHTRATRSSRRIRPELQLILDAMTEIPAFIVNKRLDIVGVNRLGRAVYAPMYERFPDPVNTARYFFLDEESSHRFWVDWEDTAANGVAILRAEHALRPHDEDISELIEELRNSSADFAKRWDTHDVYRHTSGRKSMNHPIVGRLDLPFENLLLPADPDLSLMTFNPAPDSPEHNSLRVLALWTIDTDLCTTPGATEERPR